MTFTKIALASLLLAGTAAAETQPPAAVSQINGQLVPVGEHNEYLYTYPRWNVSTNPVGWILGLYGASVSYAVHPNIALRADVNYFRPVESDERGFELGVGAPIYLRRVYQGPFLEPGVIVRQLENSYGDASTVFGPQVLVGWHWTWDSGLNVAAAVGVGRDWSTSAEYEKLFANGYLRFGYAFN
jgi:hypothetical protein